MPPLLFERLILRLCDWPAWRARALRDALDAAPRGLLPLGGLVAAVALLAAAAGASGGGDSYTCPLRSYEQLRGSLWRALAVEEGAGGKEEQKEDEAGGRGSSGGGGGKQDTHAKQQQELHHLTTPLASAWECARLVGVEEQHLAEAWRRARRRKKRHLEEHGSKSERGPPPLSVSAEDADALVRDALQAQACNPATVALSVPCCGFEWPSQPETDPPLVPPASEQRDLAQRGIDAPRLFCCCPIS
jgi:hypothetical protein